MKHIYCLECVYRLLLGGEGSKVVLKYGRGSKLLEAAIDDNSIAVTIVNKGG